MTSKRRSYTGKKSASRLSAKETKSIWKLLSSRMSWETSSLRRFLLNLRQQVEWVRRHKMRKSHRRPMKRNRCLETSKIWLISIGLRKVSILAPEMLLNLISATTAENVLRSLMELSMCSIRYSLLSHRCIQIGQKARKVSCMYQDITIARPQSHLSTQKCWVKVEEFKPSEITLQRVRGLQIIHNVME